MSNLKYGIVYYKDTPNLGDDIQTYAASRFYPKIDYYIDRESISHFVPAKKEKVKTIVNGWFNHDKTNFLISPYIEPLFVSLHLTENDLILKPGYSFVDGYAKKVLSKYNIGCRDKGTLEMLRKKKYKNIYFSSCLTTTIDPIGEKKQGDYIVAVDMNPKIVNKLRKTTKLKIIETTHWTFLNDKMSYKEKLNTIKKYDKSTPEEKNNMVKEYSELTFDQRMQRVEKQLQLYQNAKLVVTDRIHVGLPCLGLKTNVLLIYYDYNKDRVETFKDFLVNCTEEEFFNMKNEDFQKISNGKKHLKYRNSLIETTKKFMEEDIKDGYLPDIDDYKHFLEREDYIKNLCIESIDDLKNKNKKKEQEIIDINKRYNKMHDDYEKKLEFYTKIKHSKSWKYIKKIYEFKSGTKE